MKMIMSNFIDDAERHAELYNAYTPRQRLLLEIVKDSRLKIEDSHLKIFGNEELYTRLKAVGICKAEIDWLTCTGRLLPSFYFI